MLLKYLLLTKMGHPHSCINQITRGSLCDITYAESSLPGKSWKTQFPLSAHKHCQVRLWWSRKSVEWCLCQPEQLHLMGVLRLFPEHHGNKNWNRCWYSCFCGCEHWKLLSRKAARYSHLSMGTITWVESLARYGAEDFICHHLNWQNLWTTDCSYSCCTTSHPHLCTGGRNSFCNQRRKHCCELSVFLLKQVLGERFSKHLDNDFSDKLDYSKGLSMQRALRASFLLAFLIGWIGLWYWKCFSPGGCSALCSGFGAVKFYQNHVQRGRELGEYLCVQQAW